MFRHGSLGIAPAAAFAAWLACALPEAAPAAAVDAPDAAAAALIVLPGARDVHRSSREGARGIRYRLEAEFPAAGPILDLAKRLERRGWIRIGETARNGGTLSLSGWTSFADPSAATPVRVYNWWSEWTNLGGDHVSYAFEYEAPEHGGSTLRSVSVAAGFYPARLARELKEEATRAAELYAQKHPAGAPQRDEVRRTVLCARVGDAFLLSGPAGDAVVRITGTPGDQVAYRWRFREPGGSESSGASPDACLLAAGPYRLIWFPRSPLATAANAATAHACTAANDGAVGYLAGVDVIPIPGEQFGTLDLGRVHALATLLPDRDRRLAAAAAAIRADDGLRRDAILEAGKRRSFDSGRALLVQGPEGSGVIEIVHPGTESVKYRWRYRASTASADVSGEAVASERPFPELRVGPYSMQWQARSISEVRDATRGSAPAWSADVKYLSEEFSLATIPAGDATRVDLGAISARRVSP
jgi:hypothetical protein